MLAALGPSVLIGPLLTDNVAGDVNHRTLGGIVKNDLACLVPGFNINTVFDVVAVLVFALIEATEELDDRGAGFKEFGLRVGDDPNRAAGVKRHDALGG